MDGEATKYCGHGIRLTGPDLPRCIECEIVWEQECLDTAVKTMKRCGDRLKKLIAERDIPQPSKTETHDDE